MLPCQMLEAVTYGEILKYDNMLDRSYIQHNTLKNSLLLFRHWRIYSDNVQNKSRWTIHAQNKSGCVGVEKSLVKCDNNLDDHYYRVVSSVLTDASINLMTL